MAKSAPVGALVSAIRLNYQSQSEARQHEDVTVENGLEWARKDRAALRLRARRWLKTALKLALVWRMGWTVLKTCEATAWSAKESARMRAMVSFWWPRPVRVTAACAR